MQENRIWKGGLKGGVDGDEREEKSHLQDKNEGKKQELTSIRKSRTVMEEGM